MESEFKYGIDKLTPEIAISIAEGKIHGILTEIAIEKINQCHDAVLKIAQGDKPVYSINTGFGSLCNVKISRNDAGTLQENLLKSHSVGLGNIIPVKIAKLMLILKVHALAQGYSGASLKLVERIVWHIEENVIPKVFEQGSVGASGDLCPLAHTFLPLIGEGEVTLDEGKTYLPTSEVLKERNMTKFHLGPKEGLALINGTQFMAAYGVMIAHDLESLIKQADLIGAMSLDAYLGSEAPFDPRLHQIRPHQGNIETAKNLYRFLEGSELIKSHENCSRVQDPYSFRCMPQIHGAVKNAFYHFRDVLITEINSVTDNPNIFVKEDAIDAISGGGFHGEPIALPLDYVGAATSILGNVSDRRIYLLLGETGEYGLPLYLIKGSGLNSGFMITQYLSAALASENKTSSFPASADSIPTSNGVEDLVSMGSISARKTYRIIQNTKKILGVELMCACQALDFRRPLQSSPIIEKCYNYVRKFIPFIEDDLYLSPLLHKSFEIVDSNVLISLLNEYK